MASVGQMAIQGAQQQAQDSTHTVGDAMQAYHIAATAEHARQELDMEKQKNDLSKATWFSSQIDNLQKMESGPTRNLIIDSLKKQIPQVYSSFNPDNLEILKQRPELTPALAQVTADAVNGKNFSPGALEQLTAAHGSDFMTKLDGLRQAKLGELGNQMKAEGMMIRGQTQQDSAVLGAVKNIHQAPDIMRLKTQALGIDKGNQTLEPHVAADGTMRQPTWTDLNEFKQDYSANLTGAQVGSDFKLHELGDPSFKQQGAILQAKLKGNQDQPADPAAVRYWQERGQRLAGKIDSQLSAVARSKLAGVDPQYLHNASIAPAIHAAVAPYTDGSWRNNSSAMEGVDSPVNSPVPAVAPAQAPAKTAQQQVPTPVKKPVSHYDHMSTADIMKAWTAQQQAKADAKAKATAGEN